MDSLEPCADALDSITGSNGEHPSFEAIRTAASSVQIKNGVTSNDLLPYPGTIPGTPAPWYFENHPGVDAVGLYNSNLVYARPGSTASRTHAETAGLVMHELLHNLGFTDRQIQTALFGVEDPDNTNNISDRLTELCFPGVI
jgi:hypothetical protein